MVLRSETNNTFTISNATTFFEDQYFVTASNKFATVSTPLFFEFMSQRSFPRSLNCWSSLSLPAMEQTTTFYRPIRSMTDR